MFGLPPLPRTLEASVRDLSSARAEVRASAIVDLVRHAQGDEAVRTRALPLVELALADENPRVRAAAAVALGDLRAADAVDRLIACVDDDDAFVRQMAINAVGEIGDERALPRLRQAVTDERPEVRYQAVIAFSRVAKDTSEIEGVLFAATNDDDEAVAHIALRIAEERMDGGEVAGSAGDERLLIRARALVRAGSPNLALVSAIFLAKGGDTAGHELLLAVARGESVRGHTPDKEDERAAVELVGELGLREAIPALERRAFGVSRLVKDTCAFHARIALARMGHARAVATIIADLDSARKDVRCAAVVSVGRGRVRSARKVLERLTSASVDPVLVREALAELSNADADDSLVVRAEREPGAPS